MRYFLLFLLPLLFTGCGTREVIREVKVPVMVKCVNNVPVKPDMPLQDAAASPGNENLFTLAKKSLAEIELRRGYESELEAVIIACKK